MALNPAGRKQQRVAAGHYGDPVDFDIGRATGIFCFEHEEISCGY